HKARSFVPEKGLNLFFDTCRLTAALAQVVQLGFTYVTTTLQFDTSDHRAVSLESTLYTHAVRDFTHGESRVQATVTLADYHAFKSLDTFTLTFFNFYINYNGIAGAERRNVGFQLGIFNLLN